MKKMLLLSALFAASAVMAMDQENKTAALKNDVKTLEAMKLGVQQALVNVTLSPNVTVRRGKQSIIKPAASVVDNVGILERKEAALTLQIAAAKARLEESQAK